MAQKKASPSGAMVVDQEEDDVVIVHLDKLTIGEIELAEELSGQPIHTLFDDAKPKGKLLRAIAVALRRRTEPEFTWDQAGSLRVFLGTDEPVPPTSGRGSSTGSRSRNTSRS